MNERSSEILCRCSTAPMFQQDVIGVADIGCTFRVSRAKIGQPIVTLIDGVAARMHDVADELVCIVDGSGRIVHEPRLTYAPLLSECGAICAAERSQFQLLVTCFPFRQFSFRTAVIYMKFRHPAVILRPEMAA